MKRIVIFLTALVMATIIMAQTPEKISYQAVIRNSNNQLVSNHQIGVKISILQGSENGTAVFEERHTVNTNANGLISLFIGQGTPILGTLAQINWSSATYFIQTSTDVEGGENYTIVGTSQLMSVPYALHAKTVENITETDPAFNAWDKSAGITITENQISNLQNYLTSEIDPTFNASIAAGINATDTANWNNKLDSYTETDPLFNAWNKSEGIVITESQISNLQNYLTTENDPTFNASIAAGINATDTANWNNKLDSYTETDPLFNTWNKSEGIVITESQISNLQDYLTTETDPAFTASIAAGINAADTANWNNKLDSYTETDPLFNAWNKSEGIVIAESQISDLQNYLLSETDPLFNTSVAFGITSNDTASWNNKLDSYTETDPLFNAWNKSEGIVITESQISDLQNYLLSENDPFFNASVAAGITSNDTAYWNNKLDSYTETDPLFIAWDKSEGIVITESQISDLQNYLTAETDPQFAAAFNFVDPQDGDLITFNAELGKWVKYTHNFAAATHTHEVATTEVSGFMSPTDKTKLLGIAEGAEVNVNADWNAFEGDAQILNKPDLTVFATKNMNNTNLTNLANPVNAQDAATKAYVDALEGRLRILEIKMNLSEGKTIAELLSEGVSITELISAGITIAELRSEGVTVEELLTAELSVANLIAGGVSVAELVSAGATNEADYIGLYYQGGIIFYVNTTNGTGIVCAASDLSAGKKWLNLDYRDIWAYGTAIGTGKSNSDMVVSYDGEGDYAIRLCYDLELNGFDDWFLPSKDELNAMYVNRAKINAASENLGGYAIAEATYWSSSEVSKWHAWWQDFSTGEQSYTGKENPFKVRAARYF